jgi:hypothetical protein
MSDELPLDVINALLDAREDLRADENARIIQLAARLRAKENLMTTPDPFNNPSYREGQCLKCGAAADDTRGFMGAELCVPCWLAEVEGAGLLAVARRLVRNGTLPPFPGGDIIWT